MVILFHREMSKVFTFLEDVSMITRQIRVWGTRSERRIRFHAATRDSIEYLHGWFKNKMDGSVL